MEKVLPLPLREGVGGRGFTQYSCGTTPPPAPSRKGRGRNFSAAEGYEYDRARRIGRCPQMIASVEALMPNTADGPCALPTDSVMSGRAPGWALPNGRIGEKMCGLVVFVAGEIGRLTAPIRNETPRYPRLTGTKTPVFSAGPEWITNHPYLKYFLKTIENWLPDQRHAGRS